MRKILILLLIMNSFGAFAQSINDYNAFILPKTFEFLKSENKYRMNDRTKFYLEKMGLKVYYDDQNLPAEIAENRCNALNVNLKERNSLLKTRLHLVFTNCKNQVVLTTPEGSSSEKDYEKSYSESLANTLKTPELQNYKYNGSVIASNLPITTPLAAIAPPISKPAPVTNANTDIINWSGILYAQPTETGFQLVDNSPKIVLKLQKTSLKDQYIAQGTDLNGIVFLKENKWIFEYNQDGKLKSEVLNLKF